MARPQLTTAEVVNFLFDHRATNLPAEALADIFDRLIWCLDDNGRELLEEMERWIRGDDEQRVAISLAMEEVFLFQDRETLNQVYSRVARKWPAHAKRCQEIMDAWDAVHLRAAP